MKRMHVNMKVTDLAASVRFYAGLFGEAPAVLKPDYAKWMLDDPRVNFAISTHGQGAGLDHLGLQAEDAAELADTYGRMRAAEGPVLEQGNTTCCYAASEKSWITDPDGVAWEAFLTHGESTVYGDGSGQAPTAAACCLPTSAPMATACCAPAVTACCGPVITIWHNPACGTSRNTLAMLRAGGHEPMVVEYLRTPPSRAELVAAFAAAGLTARQAMRERGTPAAELGLLDAGDDAILHAMLAHPILINRPFVFAPAGVRLCRPSEVVRELVALPGPFTKEDGAVVA